MRRRLCLYVSCLDGGRRQAEVLTATGYSTGNTQHTYVRSEKWNVNRWHPQPVHVHECSCRWSLNQETTEHPLSSEHLPYGLIQFFIRIPSLQIKRIDDWCLHCWGFYSSFDENGGRIWLFPHWVLSAYKLTRQRRIARRSIIVERWKQLRVKMQWAFHILFRQLSPHRSTVTETETRRPPHAPISYPQSHPCPTQISWWWQELNDSNGEIDENDGADENANKNTNTNPNEPS